MASYVLVIAVTAFLAGAASAVFVMLVLVVGIRKADRPRTGPPAPATRLDAVTRGVLAAGTWPNGPALGDRKDS
jgi:hypothetical protein